MLATGLGAAVDMSWGGPWNDVQDWLQPSWAGGGGTWASDQWADSNWSRDWDRRKGTQTEPKERPWPNLPHVTTRGLKNPLPLDERKELLLELIEQGRPQETVSFPRVGLFDWGPRCVHAAFMILSRAEPKTAVRSLRDEEGNYSTKYAARVLLDSFTGLYPTAASRKAVMDMLRDNCYDRQESTRPWRLGSIRLSWTTRRKPTGGSIPEMAPR